jgi:hypothetical protein
MKGREKKEELTRREKAQWMVNSKELPRWIEELLKEAEKKKKG